MAIVEEFVDLCRLCAAKTGILLGLPIFETEGELRHIDKKISVCLPVQVSIEDKLPKTVCEECAYKLDQLFDFREKCLQTEGMFVAMLKEIGEVRDDGENMETLKHDLEDSDQAILADCRNNEAMLEECKGHQRMLQDCGNEICSQADELQTMQVMDEMDLAGREQVVSQGEICAQDGDIQVAGIELDGDTVRMVDQHMREMEEEVSSQQITMHLEGDMTVVSNLTVGSDLTQLDIKYVTSISQEDESCEARCDVEQVQFCKSVKFEPVAVDEQYRKLPRQLQTEQTPPTTDDTVNIVSENGFRMSQSESETEGEDSAESEEEERGDPLRGVVVPSTSQQSTESTVEYSKIAKNSLLESTLSNPSIDESGNSWYVCPLCNEASTEPSSLAEHFEVHFCSCPCGVYYTSVEALNLHKQRCEKSAEISQNSAEFTDADGVGQSTTSPEDRLVKKTASRQKWTPKVCAECGKQYRTNYKLQEHMRKHTGEKPFQCLLCEKAFRSKIGLAQHTATHTGQFDYNCSTCGKGFQCKSYLIVHQRVHSDLKPYPCNTCGQNFKTKQSLLDHQNRHLGVKPYMCEICGRGFITKGLCKSHQKIHSGIDNRQYPCIVCNKMFVSKSYLNTHLRIHTGEKPYKCEVCAKGFLTRVDLKIHSTMHTGEKSFVCEMCGKAFARRAALRCHRRSHTGERPYRCDVCGKTFTQFSPMAIHKRLHTGERPYECDVCRKAFVSRSTMMCHRKKNHGNTSTDQKDVTGEVLDIMSNEIVLRGSHDGIPITAD